MNCNIIKDLIPLYIDNCCSKESGEIIEEHLEVCTKCKSVYEDMKNTTEISTSTSIPTKIQPISNWKASVLQSILLFVSFAIITIGVAFEAFTPSGFMNGFWAFTLVIPSTAFMLSLANWNFIRLYKSRKRFSDISCLATFVTSLVAYIGVGFYYELNILETFQYLIIDLRLFYGSNLLVLIAFCVLSKTMSNKYAKMLGKE